MNTHSPSEGTGQALYRKAKRLIPGGAQLLGKRSEMYLPELWPAYYSKAKGCRIWDLDGQEYLDCTMVGIGAAVLGYADPDVTRAAVAALESGSMTTLNPPEEVALAELLCELHPWADMARFARTGGEAMAVAIRIARAATGREKIAFCGYHGWHDWYLSANLSEDAALDGHLLPGLEPLGVPRGLKGTLMPFTYNRLEELQHIVAEHGDSLAAIVMEPVRETGPEPGFLEGVRAAASACGAVLLFDEITSGWRMATSGMHRVYGVDPDMATFGKTISNGVPMSAVIGRAAIMDYAQRTFISSAYWTERTGPAAALATLEKHRREDVGRRLIEIGSRVQDAWTDLGRRHGLEVSVTGIPPLACFSIACAEWPAVITLYNQRMLERSILASDRFYANWSHTDEDLNRYFEAADDVFGELAEALQQGDVAKRLRGPVKHMGFRRLTQ